MRKALFICSRNKIRSLTAEGLFKGSEEIVARSRGTEKGARIRVSERDIGWADEIYVMEKRHAERLRGKFGDKLAGKPLCILRIKDIYTLNEERLLRLLKSKLAQYGLVS
ncbi:MAG: protein tyrosine phosphatase [Verrucomicrobiota bacterium]